MFYQFEFNYRKVPNLSSTMSDATSKMDDWIIQNVALNKAESRFSSSPGIHVPLGARTSRFELVRYFSIFLVLVGCGASFSKFCGAGAWIPGRLYTAPCGIWMKRPWGRRIPLYLYNFSLMLPLHRYWGPVKLKLLNFASVYTLSLRSGRYKWFYNQKD